MFLFEELSPGKTKTLNNNLSFGIRPHDISITNDNNNDSFEANIFLKEPLGDVTILDIAINNNKLKNKFTLQSKYSNTFDLSA